MSALAKAAKAESDAYAAMCDASADVIARQLEGVEDATTAKLRRRAQAMRTQWLAAARRYEEVNARQWDFEHAERVTERRVRVAR